MLGVNTKMTHLLKSTFIPICFLLTYQTAIAQDLQEKMFQFKSVKDTGYVKAELFLLKSKIPIVKNLQTKCPDFLHINS
jgi:hypothetical protein